MTCCGVFFSLFRRHFLQSGPIAAAPRQYVFRTAIARSREPSDKLDQVDTHEFLVEVGTTDTRRDGATQQGGGT
jgi:hypothetical protein